MKYIRVPGTDLRVSNIVMGCMRICGLEPAQTDALVKSALDEGINFFDHADIYGGSHQCETHFAQSVGMTPALRERMILQSKCGIEKGYYDFSRKHMLEAVESSLRALQTEYLDVLLLHRPDTLWEPEEVAETLSGLKQSGKVRHFGVSNFNPAQIRLLKKYFREPLLFNQLQFGLCHAHMIDTGLSVNMGLDQSCERTDSVLEYCRLEDITIQAWSPMQWGFFDGVFLGDVGRFEELNRCIDRLAKAYQVSPTSIAIAWITRHPANMQVVLGTTKPERIADSCDGSEIPLTRQEWYELYQASGKMLP